jgi:DNA (cytosine-5)-methyltransferase 1
MKHGSLFFGIGGFDLAAQWMGWENVFHCEIAEFPRKVLKHYWPDALSFTDIKELNYEAIKNASKEPFGGIDIVSGGFP